jgi:hypothetical protein
MKILLTGMASGHTSEKVHQNNEGFFGRLHSALSSLGHEIHWQASSTSWDKEYLDSYDKIFVGVVPPTALSANKAYGALSVIELMFDSPKLRLVVDQPQHWLLEASLNSVLKNPKSLVKPFYFRRSEYSMASKPEVLARLIRACELLQNESWPITIYPGLPWKTDESVSNYLPSGAEGSLVGMNFDSVHNLKGNTDMFKPENIWTTNDLYTRWTYNVQQQLRKDIDNARQSKKQTDYEVAERIAESVGFILAPQERHGGTWWSPTIMMALNGQTPIITEWRETLEFSKQWSYLAPHIEHMEAHERYAVTKLQKQDYLDAIPTREEALETLSNLIEN